MYGIWDKTNGRFVVIMESVGHIPNDKRNLPLFRTKVAAKSGIKELAWTKLKLEPRLVKIVEDK